MGKFIIKFIMILLTFCTCLLLLTNLEPFQANNIDLSYLYPTEDTSNSNITIQIFYTFVQLFPKDYTSRPTHFDEIEQSSITIGYDTTECEETETYQEIETTCAIEETQYTESYQKPTSIYDDDYDYQGFYGRLYIPSADINVALYSSNAQAVVDRQDSAAIFSSDGCEGLIIGDHNYDGFSRLFNIGEGTTGYIILADGNTINIRCTWFGYGHNAGYITYDNYEPIFTGYDYLLYTCYDGWQNVGVWKWSIY